MQSQLPHHSEGAASRFSDSLLKASYSAYRQFIYLYTYIHQTLRVQRHSVSMACDLLLILLMHLLAALLGTIVIKCYLCNCPISHCSLRFLFLPNWSGTECGLLPIHLYCVSLCAFLLISDELLLPSCHLEPLRPFSLR